MRKSYLLLAGIILISYCALITISCNNSSENKQASAVDSLAKANEQSLVDAENLIKTFPSPFEVTQLLNKAGASYILDISNSGENSDKYITLKSRALNMGIYGADLCYASTYNKKQETTNFIVASQKIVEKLEIASCFDKAFSDRINKNFDVKDSLINLVTKQFNFAYESLNKSGRSNISALSVCGATVEGLFLTTQLTSFAKVNTELKKIIASQKENLTKLTSLLSLYKNNKDIEEVAEKMKELKAIFEGVTETLTDEQLKSISSKVEMIRNEFVKP